MSFGFNNALTCKRGRREGGGREEEGGRREEGGGRRGRIQPLPAVACVFVFEMLLNTKGVPGMIERGITH